MPITEIAAVLDRHGVPWYIEGIRIYADTMAAFTIPFEEVEDLTGYTLEDLRAWLGY